MRNLKSIGLQVNMTKLMINAIRERRTETKCRKALPLKKLHFCWVGWYL